MRSILPVLAVAVVLLTAPAALAASGGDDKGGGLAFLQLHRYDLGIFTLIVFGLLVLVLSKTAWPKITEGLAKREASILGARDEAQKVRAEAEELRARLQKESAEAQDKIRALLDEARRDADALRATEKEAGVKEAQAERERAKREIEAAKDTALDEIYRTAVDLATNLSAKTLGRSMTADDHRKLLDESLAELKQSPRLA
ncbi:ATP synthase F0 subunit B [bacterium]|nr:ATP synthase F0 subunit B [bacterium]